MFQALFAGILGIFLISGPALAQSLNASYFDFEKTASGSTLTVAMDPPQAFEVVRTSEKEAWSPSLFRERGDVLVAYVQDGVTLRQNGSVCTWEPRLDPVASSTLDAMANGITVTGVVSCPTSVESLEVTSDLFTTRFPGHENIIRRAMSGDYQELATLTATSTTAVVRISDAHVLPSRRPDDLTSRRPDRIILALAVIGLLGTIIALRRNN
jgi:hypothetical protein